VSEHAVEPLAFLKGGDLLVQQSVGDGIQRLGLLAAGGREIRPLFETRSDMNGSVSPNGQWIAYQSNESGQFEIYVRPYGDTTGRRWLASERGGIEPSWAGDGRTLFYTSADASIMSVAIPQKAGAPIDSRPVPVLRARYFRSATRRQYDLSPDGQRFLVMKEGGGMIVVVQNWFRELERLVPARPGTQR
jgi:serine/threonine-protein kinase